MRGKIWNIFDVNKTNGDSFDDKLMTDASENFDLEFRVNKSK